MIKYSKISKDVLRKKVLSFFVNVSRVAARVVSVGRAFRRRASERGADELKALSPTRRRLRGTKSSEFVAERRLLFDVEVKRLAATCRTRTCSLVQ